MTHDREANASYLYFTTIGPGGVDRTATYQRMDVDLDNGDQIVAFKVFASEECRFHDTLKYALENSEVRLEEAGNCLVVSFAETGTVQRTISWDANIDFDESGQILGIEILYADLDSVLDDDRGRLYADGKLDHIVKYLAPFDDLN